jgi:hypothetical protein
MFHNYLITALRNFTRHKLYSFINIAGLRTKLLQPGEPSASCTAVRRTKCRWFMI